MDRIASELAVKIHMCLKQRYRDTFAGQQESQNCSSSSPARLFMLNVDLRAVSQPLIKMDCISMAQKSNHRTKMSSRCHRQNILPSESVSSRRNCRGSLHFCFVPQELFPLSCKSFPRCPSKKL